MVSFRKQTRDTLMNERFERILDILLKEKTISVGELSSRLGVSEVTIRKDLTELEKQGRLLRRYGGAIPAENPQQVVSHLKRISQQQDEKHRIAKFAASMIKDGENILLDAGSTILALAKELHGHEVRVVTNNLAVANELLPDEKIVVEVIGGTLRKASGALVGPWACRALEMIRVDKVFLGCSGFDPKLGFSSENAVEAETKQKMLDCAPEIIVLADHTKFTRPAFANFAKLDEITKIITDRKPDDYIFKAIKMKKKELIIT
ncbi:MAG TPA: DeoR/GlpR transcriptional regulator [Lentisphaeria bacterium]|nr:DeoR/GlpR transcriptional regulator [Lentisphaeria bacterium]